MISPKICHCIHPFFRKYAPVSTPSSYCIRYSVIKRYSDIVLYKMHIVHWWSVCLRTALCWSSAARHFAFWPYFSGHVVFLPVSRNARRLCAFRFVVCICSFASRFGWLCLSGHFPLSWVYSWSSAATKLMAWARVQRLMQFFSWTFSFFNS